MLEREDEGASLEAVLAFWPSTPALVRDRHLTVMAANALARALWPECRPGVNLARFVFLESNDGRESDPAEDVAAALVGLLRESLDEYQEDQQFIELVGELAARSPRFADAWSAPDAPVPHAGTVLFPDTPRGEIWMHYQELRLPGASSAVVLVFRPMEGDSVRRFEQVDHLIRRGRL